MAVGKDTHVSENQPDPDGETAAARRLAEALDPSAIDALLADAKAAGTPIDGVDGLLNQMTKAVLERSLQTEMTHHLGYDRDDPAGHGTGNSRNGSSTKKVATTNGSVTISVPRDRNGEFEPQIVPKRARRIGTSDQQPTGLLQTHLRQPLPARDQPQGHPFEGRQRQLLASRAGRQSAEQAGRTRQVRLALAIEVRDQDRPGCLPRRR